MPEFQVEHCPECGNIYQRNFRLMCHGCTERLDREFKQCNDFLKRNRNATVREVSEKTGLEEARIRKWIREQKILLHDYPNLTYNCDLCGTSIRNGRLCLNCSAKLKSEIAQMNQKSESRAAGAGFHSRIRGH